MRFSDYFGLGKSQAELDFVDIPVGNDLPLFVDPYAFAIEHDPWFIECNNLVVAFFDLTLQKIRSGDDVGAKQLLLHLHEPNETHLGFSGGSPAGRGIGSRQATDLFTRLQESRARRSGLLRDLTDCELLIPGISADKISDITINIIRPHLLSYTKLQCYLLDIPTQTVSAGPCWDRTTGDWASRYADLPVLDDHMILLVPKAAVRYHPAVDHQDYYRRYVLEYLKAEHIDAGSSLVKVLKNGKRKVLRKDLEKLYPLSKDFLFQFSRDHPKVFKQYKGSLPSVAVPLNNEEIEESQPVKKPIDILRFIPELDAIPPGNADADAYHTLILGILEALFYPALHHPVKEATLHGGLKRIDIVFNNSRRRGFFSDLIALHGIKCPYVFFECKNYAADPANPELDQLAGRFSDYRGKFGILVCRTVSNAPRMLERCKTVVNDNRGFVLVLDDGDIKSLIKLRANGDFAGLTSYLDNKYRALVM